MDNHVVTFTRLIRLIFWYIRHTKPVNIIHKYLIFIDVAPQAKFFGMHESYIRITTPSAAFNAFDIQCCHVILVHSFCCCFASMLKWMTTYHDSQQQLQQVTSITHLSPDRSTPNIYQLHTAFYSSLYCCIDGFANLNWQFPSQTFAINSLHLKQ